MAIKKYNVIVTVKIRNTKTNAEREEIYIRPLISMHNKGTTMYFELIDTALDELLEEIDESILDIEEIVSHKVKIEG